MKKIFAILLPFFALLFPSFTFAISCGGSGSGLQNPLEFCTLTEFLSRLLELVAQIGFPLIVLAIVYVGFRFIMAQGKPDEINKVKKSLLWVIVGALIVLGASALSKAIEGTVTQLKG